MKAWWWNLGLRVPRTAAATAVAVAVLCAWAGAAAAQTTGGNAPADSIVLPFPFGGEDPFNPAEHPPGFELDWPSNFNYRVVFDERTGQYILRQTVGDTIEFRPSTYLDLQEFLNFDMQGNLSEYWKELQQEEDEAHGAG